jgi:hypothetical protein
MAGNPRSLGGLSTSAKTFGQEKLIADSASKMIQSMAKKTIAHAQDSMEALGWFFWNNPHQTFESTYQLPGMPDVTADRSVSPAARMQIPWEKMQLDIDPYSLTYRPPAERAAILDKMLKEVFIPFAPMFAQPGIGELLDKYTRLQAKYQNIPEIAELAETLIGSQGSQQVGAGEEQLEPMDQASQTTTHERVSRPGMTDQGNEQELLQMMASGKNNQGDGMEALAG